MLWQAGAMEVPNLPIPRTACVRLLRNRGYDFGGATGGLTSYRKCPMIHEVIDTEARVALEDCKVVVLRARLEVEGRKSANAHMDPVMRHNAAEYQRLVRKLLGICISKGKDRLVCVANEGK